MKQNLKAQALDLYRQALAADPREPGARLGLGEIYRRDVARWHFSMLNDDARNAAYDAAIARAVRPGDVVLDIGTGAGLLAMMAARAGAAHVYTCECVPLIAEKAREVIAANGLCDRITVLSKWSHQLKVGEDLPQRADVLVSEIVDNLLIGEGIIATLDHALSHLVKRDALVIPAARAGSSPHRSRRSACSGVTDAKPPAVSTSPPSANSPATATSPPTWCARMISGNWERR